MRTGDVVRFRAAANLPSDAGGPELLPAWTVAGVGAQIDAEAAEGVFVAEEPGRYVVYAVIGEGVVRTANVEVTERISDSELIQVGRGPISSHHPGDMWAFEGVDGRDYVYVGTFMHDWMKVWDVTDSGAPVLTDSIQLDARRINDVKIHPDNHVGIVTREGGSNRRNGMVLLDLADPAQPGNHFALRREPDRRSAQRVDPRRRGPRLRLPQRHLRHTHHRHIRPGQPGRGGALGARQAGQDAARRHRAGRLRRSTDHRRASSDGHAHPLHGCANDHTLHRHQHYIGTMEKSIGPRDEGRDSSRRKVI